MTNDPYFENLNKYYQEIWPKQKGILQELLLDCKLSRAIPDIYTVTYVNDATLIKGEKDKYKGGISLLHLPKADVLSIDFSRIEDLELRLYDSMSLGEFSDLARRSINIMAKLDESHKYNQGCRHEILLDHFTFPVPQHKLMNQAAIETFDWMLSHYSKNKIAWNSSKKEDKEKTGLYLTGYSARKSELPSQINITTNDKELTAEHFYHPGKVLGKEVEEWKRYKKIFEKSTVKDLSEYTMLGKQITWKGLQSLFTEAKEIEEPKIEDKKIE